MSAHRIVNIRRPSASVAAQEVTTTVRPVLGPTPVEASAIVQRIKPRFADIASTYDTRKYWPQVYERVAEAFKTPTRVAPEILDEALRWKFGHLGKPRIPGSHRELIHQLQREWPRLAPDIPSSPAGAFAFLDAQLGGPSRFITIAFLVHLLFQAGIPIIDQHNFRAVHRLLRESRPGWRGRKKPSRFEDIELVAWFMDAVITAWQSEAESNAPSSRELDKFLMMYGKSIKAAP